MLDRVKEKLVELLNAIDGNCPIDVSCFDCKYNNLEHCSTPAKADYLIANGVTVQEWIPVSDPPKKNGYYMCWKLFSAVGERKEYREEILFYEDNMWLENARSFRKEYPLYWMPLPPPPKGE